MHSIHRPARRQDYHTSRRRSSIDRPCFPNRRRRSRPDRFISIFVDAGGSGDSLGGHSYEPQNKMKGTQTHTSFRISSGKKSLVINKEHHPPRGDQENGTTVHRTIRNHEENQSGHHTVKTTGHHENPRVSGKTVHRQSSPTPRQPTTATPHHRGENFAEITGHPTGTRLPVPSGLGRIRTRGAQLGAMLRHLRQRTSETFV